jgi:hypothetical protein
MPKLKAKSPLKVGKNCVTAGFTNCRALAALLTDYHLGISKSVGDMASCILSTFRGAHSLQEETSWTTKMLEAASFFEPLVCQRL